MSKVVKSTFKSPWVLSNPHLQTCLGILTRRRVKAPIFWEELQLPDEDFVDLVWLGNRMEGPLVLLIPGLEGGLHASYISSLIIPLLDRGCRVVVMHFRCCSGRLNSLPRGYSASDSDDLQMITANLRMQNPGETIIGVGFSLGASILLKMLENFSKLSFPNTYLNAALGVSVPYDLAQTIDFIPRFYQRYLLRSMKTKVRKKITGGFDMPLSLKQVADIHSLREFDQKITAPLHGFANADDYYAASSCGKGLAKIKTNTLLIHAWDDPLVPRNCIPQAEDLGENMRLEMSEQGGHLGFISSCLPWHQQWLVQRILDFVNSNCGPLSF